MKVKYGFKFSFLIYGVFMKYSRGIILWNAYELLKTKYFIIQLFV